ncbi:MAG: aspartyl protease family protein [Bacteroidota bacterium]
MKKIYCLLLFFLALTAYAQKPTPVAKIPFHLEGNHVYIQLTIGTSDTLDFIFDTGAGSSVINTATAEALSLSGSRTALTQGASGTVESSIIQKQNINIGSLTLKKVNLLGAPLSHFERSVGKDIDGIIGYDLLKDFVIQVNYNTSQLIVYKSRGFQYQGDGEVINIDLGRVPTAVFPVLLTDGSYQKEEFIIDNGAGLTIAFTSPFAKKEQLMTTIENTYQSSSKGFSTNVANVNVGRISGLKIGNREFTNVPARIYDTKEGVFSMESIAGIIGNEIQKRYNIVFDYKRKKSYWEPNDRFENEPFVVAHSGLQLVRNDDKTGVIIEGIIPESPAASSALQLGDEIVEIDGVKASEASLYMLRLALRKNGKTVRVVYRNEQVFSHNRSLL